MRRRWAWGEHRSHLRDESSNHDVPQVPEPVQNPICAVFDRQHDSSVSHKQTGGDALVVTDARGAQTVSTGTEAQHASVSTPHFGGSQRSSGFGIQGSAGAQYRMAAKLRSFCVDRKTVRVGSTNCRLFR